MNNDEMYDALTENPSKKFKSKSGLIVSMKNGELWINDYGEEYEGDVAYLSNDTWAEFDKKEIIIDNLARIKKSVVTLMRDLEDYPWKDTREYRKAHEQLAELLRYGIWDNKYGEVDIIFENCLPPREEA